MINKFVKYIGIFLLALLILMVLGFSFFYFENKIFEDRFENAELCYGSASNMLFDGKRCECDGTILRSRCPVGVSCSGFSIKCEGEITGYTYIFNQKTFQTLEDVKDYCNEIDNVDNKQRCEEFVEWYLEIENEIG